VHYPALPSKINDLWRFVCNLSREFFQGGRENAYRNREFVWLIVCLPEAEFSFLLIPIKGNAGAHDAFKTEIGRLGSGQDRLLDSR